tara:strand:+ start:1445 stop:1822 length:378 start_codon:yes stop_codon:yes gene_type:complete
MKKSSTTMLVVLVIIFIAIVLFNSYYGSNSQKEGFSSGKEFVLVHMNGCGHCERLKPDWESASKENKSGISMRSVEMSEDDGPELCKKFNISGFPTMLLLNNGEKVADFDGERSKNGLLKFLNSF